MMPISIAVRGTGGGKDVAMQGLDTDTAREQVSWEPWKVVGPGPALFLAFCAGMAFVAGLFALCVLAVLIIVHL